MCNLGHHQKGERVDKLCKYDVAMHGIVNHNKCIPYAVIQQSICGIFN